MNVINKKQNTNLPVPPALPTMPHKRIAALSVRGDNVWRISEPVLWWMFTNEDESLQEKAVLALNNWELNQGWFIEWGNKTGYFLLAEQACHDLAKFKEALKTIPVENDAQKRMLELALMTGEHFNRPIGIKVRNILKMKKRKQGKGKRR